MSGPDADIKFVYFDLGNILLSFNPERSCQNAAVALNVDSKRVFQILYEDGLGEASERGEFVGEAYVGEICRRLNIAVPNEFQSVLDALGDMFTPIEAMVELPSLVKQSIGAIGILSNTCDSHWEWVKRQKYPALQAVWDATILSYEVGSMKPQDAIYEAATIATSGFTSQPNQILFLDDRLENVEAARRHGWIAEQVFGERDAAEKLRSYLG